MTVKKMPYINNLTLSRTLLNRIEEIYEFLKIFCPEEIESVFVTNYVNEDGSLQYDRIWFFSNSCCMEALQITKKDYDFDSPATPNSKLKLLVQYEGVEAVGQYKASGQNCDNLKEVYFKYFQQNFRK
jgi:hypothetical protein